MKVFLDTNVLLDSFLKGRPHFDEASAIVSACEFGDVEGYVSYLTIANMAYIMRKDVAHEQLMNILQRTMNILNVLPMGKSQIEAAIMIDAPDFEDVLQYECAKAGGCETIVTSNTKHFKFGKDIEVVSTEDYARQFVEEDSEETVL